ncbi:MAG: minor capsid protein [Pseudomonas sp.]|nr:minor capsid protein [Pseudomonas sp.]
MPDVKDAKYGSLPFKEAIEFFKKKLIIPSEKWEDLIGPIHAKGFTIAGATKLSLLEDFHNSLLGGLKNGQSLGEWRKDFDTIVAKHGWSYKGKRGWRTKIIFNTNKHAAYAAGRWQQLQRVKKYRPFLMYMTVHDGNVRDEHLQWHGKVYHIDDPFWKTHYPPNGWSCRCYVLSLSKSEVKRRGLKISKSEGFEANNVVDHDTGEITKVMPGIDVGWDYNVGQAWLSPDVILGQQLMDLPAKLRKPALQWFDNSVFDKPYESLVNATSLKMLKRKNTKEGISQTVGYLSEDIITHLTKQGQLPIGAAIVVKDADIAHWLRDNKVNRGAAIPLSIALILPKIIRLPDVVLFDGNNIVFARRLGDGRYAKFILEVNYKDKLRHLNSRFNEYLNTFKSSGIVDADNLREPRYEIIKGKIE